MVALRENGQLLRQLSTVENEWPDIPVALTSYKGVSGDSRVGGNLSMFAGTEPDCSANGGCNGLFWRVTYQEPQRLANVLDGTSNTFMVGEDVPEEHIWSTAFYANGDWSSCHIPLNFYPDPPRRGDYFDVVSFRSRHPGGAHFCMADGSVQFISETIEHATYRALSTRDGGEAVALP